MDAPFQLGPIQESKRKRDRRRGERERGNPRLVIQLSERKMTDRNRKLWLRHSVEQFNDIDGCPMKYDLLAPWSPLFHLSNKSIEESHKGLQLSGIV